MAGLVPAIHVFLLFEAKRGSRHKAGHTEVDAQAASGRYSVSMVTTPIARDTQGQILRLSCFC